MLSSIATVLSGSVVAQLIGIGVLPVLTRLYGPDDFGRYQVYMSVLNILMMIVALRYEVGMLSAESGRVFNNLLKFTLRLILAISLMVTVLITTTGNWIASFRSELTGVVNLLPLAMLVGGLHQMLIYQPIRNRDYGLSAACKVIQSAAFAGGGIVCSFPVVSGLGHVVTNLSDDIGAGITGWIPALGHTGWVISSQGDGVATTITASALAVSVLGLVLADICGRAASGILVLKRSQGIRAILLRSQGWGDFAETACRFRKFPLMTFPGTLMSALGAAAIPLAYLEFFDIDVAGQFALVERFILLPVGVVATAIAQVFTGDSAGRVRRNADNINAAYRRMLFFLAAIGIGPSLAGMIVSPWLIPWMFGAKWQLAGELCRAGFVIAFARFLSVPVNMTLIVCERQPLQLAWEAVRFVLTLALIGGVYCFAAGNPVSFMTWYAALVVLTSGIYLVLADRATREAGSTYIETRGLNG